MDGIPRLMALMQPLERKQPTVAVARAEVRGAH